MKAVFLEDSFLRTMMENLNEQTMAVQGLEDKEKILAIVTSKEKKRLLKIQYICPVCKKARQESAACFLKKTVFICSPCKVHAKRDEKKVQAKIQATMMDRYGVKSNFCTLSKERKARGEKIGAADPAIKKKMTLANKERHGLESCSPFARKEVREKAKQTLLREYGVDHNFKIPSFIKRRSDEAVRRNQKYHNSQEYQNFFISRYIEPKGLEVLSTELKDDEICYSLRCYSCGNEFEWSIKDRIDGGKQYPYCDKCNHNGKSYEEINH